MTHTNFSLALDADWDIYVAPDGSLATVSGTDAQAQAIATECRCFQGGLFFYQEHGIAWFEDQLGKKLDKAIVLERIRTAALNVVSSDRIRNIEFKSYDPETRTFHGRIEITTEDGQDGTIDV